MLIILFVGVLLGAGVMSTALTYTGDYPVNLLILLALFVGLPLITLIGSLSARLIWRKHVPGLSSSLIFMMSKLDQRYADYLDLHLWRYGNCFYWHGQRYFQAVSLSFLLSGLATFFGHITFTDIAFGWSSTLQLEPDTVFAVTETLSAPWQALLPAAHPTLELVEASRFFRMNAANNPELLGQWWPFVATCIAVWGIVPRLLMAMVAQHRVRTTTRTALLSHAEVTALINRLRRNDLKYSVQQDETIGRHSNESVTTSNTLEPADATIVWNDAQQPVTGGIEIKSSMSAAEQTARLKQLPDARRLIRILVKGWEPPVLEFIDFALAVRQATGPTAKIAVQPQPLSGQPLNEQELTAWRVTLAKLHDPKVFVELAP